VVSKLAGLMMDSVKGYRTVVTGANGFIGSNLVRALLESEAEVICLTRPEADLWRLADVQKDVRIVTHDFGYGMPDSTKRYVGGADLIYHLAAAGVDQTFLDSRSMINTNIGGTVELLTAALQWDARRLIYCGSCFEYGSGNNLSEDAIPRPLNQYAASKSAAWIFAHAFARQHGLDVVSLRPFTVYGPFEGSSRLIPQTISKALNGSSIPLTRGEQERDFVYVDDLTEAFVRAGTNDKVAGETLNICTGIATSVHDMVAKILQLSGSESEPLFGSLAYRESELWNLSGNPDKAKRLLGWIPSRSVDQGIQETLSWFADSPDEIKLHYSGDY
jgi:nucleoside-diphosphate-sugar epimerase